MSFLYDQPTEWGRAKVRLSPFHDQLILRFWVNSTAAFQRLLSHPSQRRRFVANRILANDKDLPF